MSNGSYRGDFPRPSLYEIRSRRIPQDSGNKSNRRFHLQKLIQSRWRSRTRRCDKRRASASASWLIGPDDAREHRGLESQKNATLGTLQRYAKGLDCKLQITVVPSTKRIATESTLVEKTLTSDLDRGVDVAISIESQRSDIQELCASAALPSSE